MPPAAAKEPRFGSGSDWGELELRALMIPTSPTIRSLSKVMDKFDANIMPRGLEELKVRLGLTNDSIRQRDFPPGSRLYMALSRLLPPLSDPESQSPVTPIKSRPMRGLPDSSSPLYGSSMESHKGNQDRSTISSSPRVPLPKRVCEKLSLATRTEDEPAAEPQQTPSSSGSSSGSNSSGSGSSGSSYDPDELSRLPISSRKHKGPKEAISAFHQFNGSTLQVYAEAETLRVNVAGGMCKTTPDLAIQLERNGKNTRYVIDFEGKQLATSQMEVEKFAQEVAHLLGRANQIWAETIDKPERPKYYHVYLLATHGPEVHITHGVIARRWLTDLQRDIPLAVNVGHTPRFTRYGPVSLLDESGRLEAIHCVYTVLYQLAKKAAE